MKILAIPASYGLHKPVSGGQTRFLQLVEMLGQSGHEVSVLEPSGHFSLEDRRTATIGLFNELRIGSREFVVFRDFNPFFVWAVIETLRRTRPDIIMLNHPSGAIVCRTVVRLLRHQSALVYAAHNVESDFFRHAFKASTRHKALERLFVPSYISALERLVCKAFCDYIAAISLHDARRFAQQYRIPSERISAVRGASRLGRRTDPDSRQKARLELGVGPEEVLAIFVGAGHHTPNLEAIERVRRAIAPRAIQEAPNLRFIIAGAGLPQFDETKVRCAGFVEDLEGLLSAGDIALAPLSRGGGVKIKVLDYMAAGLAVIATATAVEGLDVEEAKQVLVVEDSDEAFVKAVVGLARDVDMRERLRSSASRLAKEAYSWGRAQLELDEMVRMLSRSHSVVAQKKL